MHRTTYFRKIDLWTATTGVDKDKQALRLLQKLTGEAFDKMENLDVDTLRCQSGVEVFKKAIVDAYEPIEDYRVGKIMDEFLDEFSRKKDQEIVDYNLAWFRELKKAEKVAGELTDKWKAHLYLKKLRMPPQQKSQVLTGALGQYTVEALQKAALTSFPNIREAFSRIPSKPSSGYTTQRKPFQKRGFRKGGRRTVRAHEVDNEDDDDEHDGDDDSEEYDEVSGDEGDSDEPVGDGDVVPDDEVPPELEDAYKEATAYLTRAKKQRAEVEKARGFFKRGARQDGKDAALKPLKGKLPCSKCGGLGHWYKDKECPKYSEAFKNKPKKDRRHGVHVVEHDVYAVSLAGVTLSHAAYVDTACAKSVVGTANSGELIQYCKDNQWPVLVVNENEPFRFGPGKRMWSEQAVVVPVCWAKQIVVLRISIVDHEVPFLISKYVFKSLGALIDLDANEVTFKKFQSSKKRCMTWKRDMWPLN